MGSNTEIEAKLDVGPGWQLPAFDDLVIRDVPTTELVAVYWDTPDGRLDDWGVTLRRRVADGTDAEWTVTLPLRGSDDGVERREELNADGAGETPPDELQGLLTAMTRGALLEPVARLRTERRRRHAGNDLWSAAVEITDDRVTSQVAGRPGPAFRQIEVELLDDDARHVMASVVDALHAAGLESSQDRSKLRRVLRGGPRRDDADPVEADRVGAEPVDASSVVGLASGAIGRRLSTVVRSDPWLRLDDDVDAVHECRKALRQLRSDLTSLRPVLDRRRTDPLRDELKWYGTVLGEVRDLHVMREQVLDAAEELGALPAGRDEIIDVLESQLALQRRNLLSALDGDRYLSMLTQASELQRCVPLRPGVDPDAAPGTVLATAGRKAWTKVERTHRRAEQRPSSERLHTLRKKVKHARGAAKLAKEAGASTKRFTRDAGTLKDVLGDLHDADVLVEWLDGLPGRLGPDGAYDAGRMRERTLQRRHELDDAWRGAWDDLDRKRLRRWFT